MQKSKTLNGKSFLIAAKSIWFLHWFHFILYQVIKRSIWLYGHNKLCPSVQKPQCRNSDAWHHQCKTKYLLSQKMKLSLSCFLYSSTKFPSLEEVTMNVYLFVMLSTLVKIGLHAESATVYPKDDIYQIFSVILCI